MKKITVTLIALLLYGNILPAQQRSEDEAIQIAKEFFSKKGQTTTLSVVPQEKVEEQTRKKIAKKGIAPSKKQGFYIVNDEANNRYVVISADERLNTVLGYSNNGTFDTANIPNGILEIFNGYNWQYELLEKNSANYTPKETREKTKAITPIIKSNWGQSYPYNKQCPSNISSKDTSLCVTGCVATAMAQIMYYHKYPAKCNGYWEYKTESKNIHQKLNFNNISFDWSNMLDT